MKKCVVINEKDNVAVALVKLLKGEELCGTVLLEDIERGHKFALRPIKAGEKIIKYGEVIGSAKCDISQGEHVHTNNMRTDLDSKSEYKYNKAEIAPQEQRESVEVEVYERAFGKVGIRNELWVIPLVGCVNAQAKEIVERYRAEFGDSGTDGVFAFTHPYGCSQTGEDHLRTRTLLQCMVRHPNAGGVLVLGLGCENNTMKDFRATLGDYDEKRVRFLVAQDVGDEIAEGVKLLRELYFVAEKDRRVTKGIECLNVGLKCGGSDGLSGITANPLLGRFSDYMASVGGATVLTEVPEMFGAERLLMARAKNEEVFRDIVGLINDFKDYYINNGQPVYENPSPGNKAGGITTLEDKSLGCTQKSGSGEVESVIKEGETIKSKGLTLLNGPGNDMVAVTNLAAAGCQMVLFTTGRGTPFGGFVPTVKVSTNTELSERKKNWIDFNAGDIVQDASFEDKLQELIKFVAEVASGKKTKNEINNTREIALFKTGVTL
jgi:altronate hydrolase